jgi:hypothetical protein
MTLAIGLMPASASPARASQIVYLNYGYVTDGVLYHAASGGSFSCGPDQQIRLGFIATGSGSFGVETYYVDRLSGNQDFWWDYFPAGNHTESPPYVGRSIYWFMVDVPPGGKLYFAGKNCR